MTAAWQSTTAKRLRRVRWVLTVLFTATTAVCIGTLATIALVNDERSRAQALDIELDRQVAGLSRVVYYDGDGKLHLEPLDVDALVSRTSLLHVWTRDNGVWTSRYSREVDNAKSEVSRELVVVDQVRDLQYAVIGDGAMPSGEPLRLAAAPVWNTTNQVAAIVVVAGDPAPGVAAHREYVMWTFWGCLAMLVLAAAAGHGLSYIGTRPAVRALEQEERFLAEAAHELRTPLATLRLIAEAGANDPVRASASAAQVVGLVDRMAQLVTGLLARARVRNGTRAMEWLPLRLDQLVEEVVGEQISDGRTVDVDLRPTIVEGDPVLLAQALRNLVDNAVKHGAREDGQVRVEVKVAGGTVTVSDRGPGIDVADRDRVFDQWVTGSSTGTGIGLAIVRWVADLHRGSARVVDSPLGGTTIELALPEVVA
ncbi:MAG: HAMP domain-containing sensor histidine kinase [Umezawaea sp.]